ncbi:MAG: radical SAM protein [Bacteroidaceae bacterium]|nr:radical SAM protein [Bacteroidaceae bacterium]
MSTIIYPSPIFGPVHSRRLGISLGINLLPEGGKLCSFDCVYCECGLNRDHRTHNPLPSADKVEECLKLRLKELKKEGIVPDVFTFAGNGEPTLNPHFPEIADRVINIRNQYCPNAKISILSNATQIHRPEIREALLKFDNNIQKLDTVSTTYIYKVDQPQGHYDVEEQIKNMQLFNGHVIIQTMFMTGELAGESVNNTTPAYVEPYIEALKRIQPSKVMIYTIDRETPFKGLKKASPDILDSIAEQIRKAGFECSVSY